VVGVSARFRGRLVAHGLNGALNSNDLDSKDGR
jgi:hypothetical protein